MGKFGNLFSWEFWTEANIDPESEYTAIVLMFAITLIAGLILWRRILKKRNTDIPVYDWPVNQLSSIITLLIIMVPSYWFFRAQQLSYLSSRLVVLITFLVVLGWIGWVVFYLVRQAPAKREAYLEKERFFRYLPKSKKGKNNQ